MTATRPAQGQLGPLLLWGRASSDSCSELDDDGNLVVRAVR